MAGKPNNCSISFGLNLDNKIENFIMGKPIGEGNFGKVMLGTHVITGEKVIIILILKHR